VGPRSGVPGAGVVSLSSTSHLQIDGDVTVASLALDGALSIRAAPGVKVLLIYHR